MVAQSCLTLCDPVKCSLSGSSVHGILQSRIPEWVAIPFSKVSSWTRGQTQVSWIASRFFTIWASKEAQHRRRSLFIGNIHSNIEYDGQHIDNFSEMHCGKETPLYCIYSVFLFPEIFRLFQNKNNYLKKRFEFFSLLHNCGEIWAIWQHNQTYVSERSPWLLQEIYLFCFVFLTTQYSL